MKLNRVLLQMHASEHTHVPGHRPSGHNVAGRTAFLGAAVLATGLMLFTPATGLAGQDADAGCSSRSIAGLAKPGGHVSEGRICVRVDSLSLDTAYLSIFGPAATAIRTAQLPRDGVWRSYPLGKTGISISATGTGARKEVFLSVSF